MQWLAFLVKPILNFLYEKAIIGIKSLIRHFEEKKARENLQDEKMALAVEIEEIVKQITAHSTKGEPVPEVLNEKLREANRRLRNHADN